MSLGDTHRKIFVGGLDYNTDEDRLRSCFEKFGDVADVIVMRFDRT